MRSFVTYTATAWRDGTSWAIRVAQLDRTTRAARLSQVDIAARRLICAVTEHAQDRIRVIVDLQVPEGLGRVLEAAAAARQEADLVSVGAVALRRTLAGRLTDHGYDAREIAVLLGVSQARARQLVVDRHDPPAATGRPLAATRSLLTGRAGSGHGAEVKPHSGYQHEAFLYRDVEEFLAGTVPFIQDAVTLQQPVMVALIRPRLELVREALGPVSGQVLFVDMAELGGNPARIIPAWLGFIQDCGGTASPIRGIGEPQWVGRRPEEAVECQLHEGLLNLAIHPDVPLWLRCPYDASGLPADLLDAASESHPALVERGDYRGSTKYGGLHHVNSVFGSELPPAPTGSARLAFAGADLVAVRQQVTRCGIDAGLVPGRFRALTQAVAEIAGNSVRHGGGKGELLTWTEPGALVCEVSDQGRLGNPLVGRRTPLASEEKGRGLWLANQISDLVQIRSTPLGTTARVFAWL